MFRPILTTATALAAAMLLSGCIGLYPVTSDPYSDIAPAPLRAVGYAPIEAQPGPTPTEQMLQAMQASKLEAYRELSEQIHGLRLESETGSFNQVQDNVVMKTRVSGLVRGARVVSSYPLDDVYVTELELDLDAPLASVAGQGRSFSRSGGSY